MQIVSCHVLCDIFHDFPCLSFWASVEQDGKFISAHAGYTIRRPHVLAQQCGKLPDHAVTTIMSQVVVHKFQAVEIENKYACGTNMGLLDTLNFRVEVPATVGTGERIGVHGIFQSGSVSLGSGNVRVQTDQSGGLAVGIPVGDIAPAQYPSVSAICAAHSVGTLEAVTVLGRVDDQKLHTHCPLYIIRMNTVHPAFGNSRKLLRGIAEHGQVSWRIGNGVVNNIPVPEAISRCADCLNEVGIAHRVGEFVYYAQAADYFCSLSTFIARQDGNMEKKARFCAILSAQA